ncbi:MAG: methionine ABC transporter permease [Candidatus Faecivicinus sp.]|nr:methionine ABC transporter permease [Candidatus Faecivicinus sp.]
MKRTKTRIAGAVILILGLAIALTGVFGSIAEREGTPFSRLYAQASEHKNALSRLNLAIQNAQEALERADKRASDALAAANDVVKTAEAARETSESGSFDSETEVGALGQSILEARGAGENVDAIYEKYESVAFAELTEQLDSAKTEAGRAENANDEAVEKLNALVDAVLLIQPDATLNPLNPVEHASVPKLGDRTGLDRLETRAENYVTRGTASVENAKAIAESGNAILDVARSIQFAQTTPASDSLIAFAHQRSADLIAAGAILFLIGALLAFCPNWIARKWKVRLFRNGSIFVFVVLLLAAALHYAGGEMWDLMRQGVFDTLYMTIPSTFFAYVVGLPLGVLLVITAPGHIRENHTLNNAVGTVVNFLRSIPFIILLVMLFDVTRFVMGSAIGTRACIFPLFVSAFPYVARIVEGSLAEVDKGVIEAAESMGSTTWQIIRKVLIPEAMPSLINGAALCMTTILAYTAMAGSAGGDGLGKIAITYGLNYREYDIMYVSSLLLVALVQIIQIGGDILMRAVDHRKK